MLNTQSLKYDTGYPHDGRADKDSYPPMHYVNFIIMVIVRIDKLASIYLIEQTSF